jgi:hypothetical protein
MRRSRLTDDTPILVIKMEHFVKSTDFAHALADHYWCNSEEFDPKITKTEAMKILKSGLFFNGLNGEFRSEQFEAADQSVFNEWNRPFEAAHEWVIKNYPYLKSKEVTNG